MADALLDDGITSTKNCNHESITCIVLISSLVNTSSSLRAARKSEVKLRLACMKETL